MQCMQPNFLMAGQVCPMLMSSVPQAWGTFDRTSTLFKLVVEFFLKSVVFMFWQDIVYTELLYCVTKFELVWAWIKVAVVENAKKRLLYPTPTFYIKDSWVTSACPEKLSVPWIHCIEYIFFIIQEFWATCAFPENFQAGGKKTPTPRPPRAPMRASVFCEWRRQLFHGQGCGDGFCPSHRPSKVHPPMAVPELSSRPRRRRCLRFEIEFKDGPV